MSQTSSIKSKKLLTTLVGASMICSGIGVAGAAFAADTNSPTSSTSNVATNDTSTSNETNSVTTNIDDLKWWSNLPLNNYDTIDDFYNTFEDKSELNQQRLEDLAKKNDKVKDYASVPLVFFRLVDSEKNLYDVHVTQSHAVTNIKVNGGSTSGSQLVLKPGDVVVVTSEAEVEGQSFLDGSKIRQTSFEVTKDKTISVAPSLFEDNSQPSVPLLFSDGDSVTYDGSDSSPRKILVQKQDGTPVEGAEIVSYDGSNDVANAKQLGVTDSKGELILDKGELPSGTRYALRYHNLLENWTNDIVVKDGVITGVFTLNDKTDTNVSPDENNGTAISDPVENGSSTDNGSADGDNTSDNSNASDSNTDGNSTTDGDNDSDNSDDKSDNDTNKDKDTSKDKNKASDTSKSDSLAKTGVSLGGLIAALGLSGSGAGVLLLRRKLG